MIFPPMPATVPGEARTSCAGPNRLSGAAPPDAASAADSTRQDDPDAGSDVSLDTFEAGKSSPRADPVLPSGSKWKRLVATTISAALLLPIPVFAAINWKTDWAITTGTTTQNVNTNLNVGYGAVLPTEPDWLFIQPTVLSNTTTTITLQRDFLAAPSEPVNASAIIDNIKLVSGNVQLAVWTTHGSTEGDIIGSSTMPVQLNGNNQLLSNQFGTGPRLADGRYTLHVEFFINSTNWSISSSSPSRVTFQFAD